MHELPAWERFKRVPDIKWEQKNNNARIFLKEQYYGKCQICEYTFSKKNGEPYFEGLYLVSRTKATWVDRPGNILCLCANCCAKFQYGQIQSENILEQIHNFKCIKEGGETVSTVIKLRLCNEEVALKFSERHILDLQELLLSDMEN